MMVDGIKKVRYPSHVLYVWPSLIIIIVVNDYTIHITTCVSFKYWPYICYQQQRYI